MPAFSFLPATATAAAAASPKGFAAGQAVAQSPADPFS